MTPTTHAEPIPATPIARELKPALGVVEALHRLAHLPGCLLLDSSMPTKSASGQWLGRYSFLMADPFEWMELPVGAADVTRTLRETLCQYQIETIPGLPPMQSGLAGLLSYDLNRSFETVPDHPIDEFELPAIAMGCYDTVIAWDHWQQRCWIISSGFPVQEAEQRQRRMAQRIEQFLALLSAPPRPTEPAPSRNPTKITSPSFEAEGPEGLTSNFSREGYIEAVQKCIDYIHAGDVFQVNLAQRLLMRANCGAIELFERLRQCNPSPFGGYFDLTHGGKYSGQIVSASPERFFSVRDGVVETRPIKGTRRKTGRPLVDIHAGDQLLGSVKDRAENIMIVDLMRNDLSRCCEDDSIRVTQLCELETYQSVMHLVSAVEGHLKPTCDLADLVEAIFPGGSITGAPKVRAMEIIAELEPSVRGAYCGALGYLGFDGNADFNLLIRTITASGGWWQIPVGGGIIAPSNPVHEYEETRTKAAGLLRATARRSP